MSKTIDLQIEKSRLLIDGARKNLHELQNKGFSAAELDKMAADLDALKAANIACDQVREELSKHVKHVNSIMDTVKTMFAEKKKIIKQNYLQEQWIKYGVQDAL